MYKVEIQNLNTSELPKLSTEELNILLNKAKKNIGNSREEFIHANLRLVLSMVQKFNNRGENLDDIFQVGVIGLLKALDNFNLDLNVQFSTYAVPMILGEIKRYLRDLSSLRITRSLRDIAYKVMKEKEIYINQYNCEPTISQLSEILNESKEDIVLALESMVEPVSIYETVYSESGNNIEVVDQIKDDIDESEHLMNRLVIKELMQNLNEKEKNIIEKRFFKNVTQVELANEIGVSQAQISRIEKAALLKMRKKIGII